MRPDGAQASGADDDEDDRSEDEELRGDDGSRDEELDDAILVRRASSVDGWEMFRVEREAGPVVASIAVRAPARLVRRIEIAVWRPVDDDEPGATSSVERQDPRAAWNDEARTDVLRQVLYRYEEDLGVSEEQVVFALAKDEDDAVGDEPDDDASPGAA